MGSPKDFGLSIPSTFFGESLEQSASTRLSGSGGFLSDNFYSILNGSTTVSPSPGLG